MTTTTRLPAWLELDKGEHKGECGVCVEECLALLLGQDKTDYPDRVHPIIRDLAIRANDAEDDPKKRRKLAQTLACQVDTDDVTQEVTNGLAAFVCRYAAGHLPEGTARRTAPPPSRVVAGRERGPGSAGRRRARGSAGQ